MVGTWRTVTAAEPTTVPEVAEADASPTAIAVPSPEELLTDSTAEFVLDHVTEAPDMICPF